MPVSNPEHIPAVLHFAQTFQPKAILDVGVGTGSYGLLLRQGFDVGHGRINPESWITHIEGVEIFEAYRNPVWSYAYSRVRIGDIRQLLPDLGEYDLVLCNDVLEHFPRAEVGPLIEKLLAKARILIATTPNIDFPQGAWGGNEAERHHCLLTAADFPGLVATVHTGITSCYVCTRDQALHYPILLAADRCPGIAPGRPLNPWIRFRRKWRLWRLRRK